MSPLLKSIVVSGILLAVLLLIICLKRSDQADTRLEDKITPSPTSGVTYQVTDYGTLYPGVHVTDEQKKTNTQTIQRAIDTCGQNGGGTVVMPSGYYCVTLLDNGDSWPACLIIKYSNLTFKGMGMASTTIQTRGEWNVVKGEVLRGHGLRIDGTNDPANPTRNINISDMEIYGGTVGYTGNFDWPANTTTGDGWDISHKGIVVCHNDNVDQVTLENLHVHDYKGEVIYGGGHGLSKLVMRNCKLRSSNADLISLAADLVCENVEGDLCFAYVENVPIHPMRFILCKFSNAKKNGLCITKSPDFGTWEKTASAQIAWCQFKDSEAAAIVLGSKAYKVKIHDNTFINHSIAVRGMHSTKDVEVYNNRYHVSSGSQNYFIQIYDANYSWNIHNNTVNCTATEKAFSLGYAGYLSDISLHDNTFTNVSPPNEMWALDPKSQTPKSSNNKFNP